MESFNTIEVTDVRKSYRIYMDKGSTFKEKVIFTKRRKYEEKQVLKGISFRVKRGEAVGLVGHNGCGKSTILKLLTCILYPDGGQIEINGMVSSLIELGAGFHPDMSGRENIYINASIFGLNRKEIEERMGQIIGFSELEEYIDNPVRTYSSGMYMRLAFSVAINVDAEVLLIDEILSVGDVNFQQKCFERLREIKKAGTTIVIVSHALTQIEQICDRSIWIDDGLIREEGSPKEVHEKYLSAMEDKTMHRIEKEEAEKETAAETETEKEKDLPAFCGPWAIRRGNHKAVFTNVHLEGKDGRETKLVRTGEELHLLLAYQSRETHLAGTFGIGIYRDDDIYCFGTNTAIELKKEVELKREAVLEIIVPRLMLLAGKYSIHVAMHSQDLIEIYDYIWNVIEFQVFNTKGDDGLFRMETIWRSGGEILIDNR